MAKILYINHDFAQCGVFQAGDRLGKALQKHQRKHEFNYQNVNSFETYAHAFSSYQPDLVFANFFPPTMGWFTKDAVSVTPVPILSICHETYMLNDILDRFGYAAVLDPIYNVDDPRVLKTRNGLPDYIPDVQEPKELIVGSFGFAFPNKGWHKIMQQVNEEFDEAHIRFHMPLSTFGDGDGAHIRARKEDAANFPFKPGITIEFSHDYKSETDLIDWLAGNTINCFFYDEFGERGVSSTTDYAIAARRPIAISSSSMFHNLNVPGIRVPESTIKEIIAKGTEPLYPLYKYTMQYVVEEYENFINRILNA